MNIYDTAHRLAAEISSSDECVRLRELRERAYADDTNRILRMHERPAAAPAKDKKSGTYGYVPDSLLQLQVQ